MRRYFSFGAVNDAGVTVRASKRKRRKSRFMKFWKHWEGQDQSTKRLAARASRREGKRDSQQGN